MEVEKDNVQSELRAVLNELESKSTDYMMMEKEKKRLDGLIQKANDQADQRVNEVHEHLERIEAKLREDNDKNEKEIMRLSREVHLGFEITITMALARRPIPTP
jgi:predicted  nucleic acid-binding Zn-ribbon protein